MSPTLPPHFIPLRLGGTRTDKVLRCLRPRYIAGHSINMGFLVLSLILTTMTMLYAGWENKKRAQGDRAYRLAEGDEGALGYRHPQFRYTM